MSEPLDLATLRYVNETAIRDHALKCSQTYRAGRFTRMGEDFLDEVKADVEKLVRELRGKFPTFHPALPAEENTSIVTGLLSAKLSEEFNNAVCRLIQNKVQRQPSCGKTLSRTR